MTTRDQQNGAVVYAVTALFLLIAAISALSVAVDSTASMVERLYAAGACGATVIGAVTTLSLAYRDREH